MPRDLKSYLEGYIEEYFLNTDMVITGISLGGIGINHRVGATLEQPSIELEEGWQFVNEDTNKKEKENIIEIQEPIGIEQNDGFIYLEKGDRISVLEADSETFKCPECGSKVLKNTGYCLSCKKKVKEK